MRAILVADSYSYKTHVTRDNRTGRDRDRHRGRAQGPLSRRHSPDWVTPAAQQDTVIDLGDGYRRHASAPRATRFDIPGYGTIERERLARGRGRGDLPEGPLPDWINASRNRARHHHARRGA